MHFPHSWSKTLIGFQDNIQQQTILVNKKARMINGPLHIININFNKTN